MSQGWSCKVDYMQCRSKREVMEVFDAVGKLFAWTGEAFTFSEFGKGKDGYTTGAELLLGGARVGRMDWGGEVMREWVRVVIEGTGCGWVEWAHCGPLEAISQLRRCDPCVTWFDGSMTHERVQQAYRDGGFKGQGRPPKARIVMSDGDPWAGRSFYVGAPQKGQGKPFKFARCYEKGLEVLMREGRVPTADTNPTLVLVDGHPARDVYRIEVEFNAQGPVPLPWDMVRQTLGYWRGSYPWLASLIAGSERYLCEPARPMPGTDLARQLEHVRTQYGEVLFTALQLAGGDVGAVMAVIIGQRHSERMVRSGALLGRGLRHVPDDPLNEPFSGINRQRPPHEVEESLTGL